MAPHRSVVRCLEIQYDLVPRTRAAAYLIDGGFKADGYGHGILLAARSFLSGGADVVGRA